MTIDSLTRQTDTKTIKVANIILDGRFGGPQNRILQVAERLKGFGIETTVIIPAKESDDFYSRLTRAKILTKKMRLHKPSRHLPRFINWAIFLVPETLALSYYLRKERFDLIHCNSPWQMKGVLAGAMAGAKIVWHLNDTELPLALRIAFKAVGRLADGFIVAGKSVYRFHLEGNKLGGKRVIEIQAPVDVSYLNPETIAGNDSIKKRSGLKIMTVGTINPTKRIESLIEVASILNKKYENLGFYVLGPRLSSQRKYADKLDRLRGDYGLKNFFFLGASDNVASILKSIDIYVCASQSEASPMAVWEAMAMKKAIVSTDVGDISVFIEDGESGFIVPPFDVNALAEKIEILLENENLRRNFGERARVAAVQNLDIEICVEKHRQFYLDTLNGE